MALPDELRVMRLPPQWGVYFQVADADATVADVKMAPTDIPALGRVAFVRDPQDAGVGLRVPDCPPDEPVQEPLRRSMNGRMACCC